MENDEETREREMARNWGRWAAEGKNIFEEEIRLWEETYQEQDKDPIEN